MENTDKIRAAIERHINVLLLMNSISEEHLLKEKCISVDFVYMRIQEAKNYIISGAEVSATDLTAEAVISSFTKNLRCSRNEFVSALDQYIENQPEEVWRYLGLKKTISSKELIDYILQKHFK